MDEYIFENKEYILRQINNCIDKNNMNILFIGEIPHLFIEILVKTYYKKKYDIDNYNEYVLINNCYSDTNICSQQNNIIVFSKKKTLYNKIIIIYNLEEINENIQSYFKNLMNNNTFFIFQCDSIGKIYETIQMRCENIIFEKLSIDNYKKFMIYICKKENINIDDDTKDLIIKYSNMNTDFFINIIKYFKLLQIHTFNKDIIDNYINHIQFDKIKLYFENIKCDNIKEAIKILFYYHDKGYSLLDLYNFIYDYIKTLESSELKYNYIIIISEYINSIYDGFDNKICLVFLTNELISLHKIENNI